jgi:hypothetical protein
MAGATIQAAGTEAGINAAAVIAYRASLDNRQPLSERSLAAMFGKTSRRWARHRMAEARQAPATAVVEVESAEQPPVTTHLCQSCKASDRLNDAPTAGPQATRARRRS